MRIWLFNPYGPIPGEGWREYRFALIARTLARRGHEVIWWTSTFAHHSKVQRAPDWTDIAVEPGFTVRLVPSPSYRDHVSLRRVWFEIVFAFRAYRRGLHEAAPELIVAGDPPQVVSCLGVRLARRTRARLAIDLIDLWPEMFVGLAVRRARPAVEVALSPLRALRRRNLRRAAFVTTVCNTYTALAKREVGHPTRPSIETVFIGVDQPVDLGGSDRAQRERNAEREALGLTSDQFVAVYAGTLGMHYDVPTLLSAAELLSERSCPIRVVIAGDGPLRPQVEYAGARQGCGLIFLGRVDASRLWRLYTASDVGLCTYGAASTVALPSKAYDYLAAGLPIVSSLRGELESLLRDRGVGVQYTAGDADSLACVLARLARDRDARAAMGRNARWLAQEFVADRQYARMAQMLGA